MINYLVPVILLISLSAIIRKMYKEYIKREKEIEQKESEIRFLIEQRVMRDVKERSEWWDNFDIGHYVNVLENR